LFIAWLAAEVCSLRTVSNRARSFGIVAYTTVPEPGTKATGIA